MCKPPETADYLGADQALRVADVVKHHSRVPLQPSELRALHRGLPKRHAGFCLRHRKEIHRKSARILFRKERTRLERRLRRIL